MASEPSNRDGQLTGGCQCGAVRYRIDGRPGDSSICHCRMCQKAFGAFYAPLVSTRGARLTWTRGEPKRFRSSNHVQRGFCGDCGTPLTYEAPDGIAISTGSLDDPAAMKPVVQWGIEAKLPWCDEIPGLPAEETMADLSGAPFLSTLVNLQHPDHDTAEWPQRRS